MQHKNPTEATRVLDEMFEMARVLQDHDLITMHDMAKMKLICQRPPQYTPENVTAIRIEKAKVSQSVLASMLNVSVSAVQKWESLIDKKGLEAIVA